MKLKLTLSLKIAIPLAIVATIIIGFTHVAVQQSYRQSANDPQLQLAGDAALALSKGGKTPEQAVGAERVDLHSSLAPFLTVYDTSRQPLATSGKLGDQTLSPPEGTFDYAKTHGRGTFTWQTADGNRYATVLQYFGGDHPGYVLAARNLYEVEQRESWLTTMTIAAFAAMCIVILAFLIFVR